MAAIVSIRKAETTEEFCRIESWVSNERIWKYLGPPFTNGGYKHNAMAFASRKGISVLFTVGVGDIAAGVIGLSDICSFHKRGNLWFALGDTEYAGKGVIRLACKDVLHYAFKDLSLHSIYGWTIEPNKAAARILVANGFIYYGTQVEAFFFDGEFVDVLWFNLLNTA